ncbi:MAG: hypothetical protein U7126_14220 [Microcoleus sp.]
MEYSRRKKAEGSSATDSVTDLTDLTDVTPGRKKSDGSRKKSDGSRKKSDGRSNSGQWFQQLRTS